MTYKELMYKSLTELLKDGETLMCPIYGALNQGDMQHYGYFGFTKTHLLMTLITGKTVMYAKRIPLDIKSIRIKQSAVFRQYEIFISFNNGDSYIITASPRVLMIDTQKENMPQLLDYLKSNAPQNREDELKDSDGEKIRWQYFNGYIYIMSACFPMALIAVILSDLKGNGVDFAGLIEGIVTALLVWSAFLAPAIVLSLLNRFFFGRIIGVIREDGLLLENDFIEWKKINKITFKPRMSSKHHAAYTHATVSVGPGQMTIRSIDIMHFPAYALRRIKKHNPEIKVEVEKKAVAIIVFVALLPTLLGIAMGLLV